MGSPLLLIWPAVDRVLSWSCHANARVSAWSCSARSGSRGGITAPKVKALSNQIKRSIGSGPFKSVMVVSGESRFSSSLSAWSSSALSLASSPSASSGSCFDDSGEPVRRRCSSQRKIFAFSIEHGGSINENSTAYINFEVKIGPRRLIIFRPQVPYRYTHTHYTREFQRA